MPTTCDLDLKMHRRRQHTKISTTTPSKLGADSLEEPIPHIKISSGGERAASERYIERMAGANAVVIFSRSTCCMCHAAKRLFCGMGVHPTVHDLDEHPKGKQIYRELLTMRRRHCLTKTAGGSAVPVVFIGGNLVGGIETVLAAHINGTLVPLLKQAGALWL